MALGRGHIVLAATVFMGYSIAQGHIASYLKSFSFTMFTLQYNCYVR